VNDELIRKRISLFWQFSWRRGESRKFTQNSD